MVKRIFLLLIIFLIQLYVLPSTLFPVYADEVRPNGYCAQGGGSVCCNAPTGPCITDGSYECLPTSSSAKYSDGSVVLECLPSSVGKIFGKIKPPAALRSFIENDLTGTRGISKFFNNFVSLIYIAATIVLVFMLLWGAWDWITSEGDKEKLESAKKKLINAFIGIILFAVAFALMRVLGAFTGFTFFTG